MTRLALALALLATPVAADTPQLLACLPVASLNAALQTKYREQPAAEGIASNGAARLVIWANPDTGTWTAAVVGTSGTACLVGSGEGWEVAKPKREERAS